MPVNILIRDGLHCPTIKKALLTVKPSSANLLIVGVWITSFPYGPKSFQFASSATKIIIFGRWSFLCEMLSLILRKAEDHEINIIFINKYMSIHFKYFI